MTYQLIHGDCFDVLPTLAPESVSFAFVDPPYNVGKDYGTYKDNLDREAYFSWCESWIYELNRITGDNVAVYPPKIYLRRFWNMLPDNHQIVCGWSPEGAIRSGFVHQYVPLLVPPKPLQRTHDHWWNAQVPGLGYFYREKTFGNPGQTSLDITERIIKAFTNPGDIVIDCFMGVGTTGVACLKHGRHFIGIELDKDYYDIAVKRCADAAAQPRLLDVEPLPQPEQVTLLQVQL